METEIQKFQNELPLIFGNLHPVEFIKMDNTSYCVRSSKTGMFCGVHLKKMIPLCESLGLNYYVRSLINKDDRDCVDFVIYL